MPTVRARTSSQVLIEYQHFKNRIDSSSLWCPVHASNHDEWIINLVCALLMSVSDDKCYIQNLSRVCKVQVSNFI